MPIDWKKFPRENTELIEQIRNLPIEHVVINCPVCSHNIMLFESRKTDHYTLFTGLCPICGDQFYMTSWKKNA